MTPEKGATPDLREPGVAGEPSGSIPVRLGLTPPQLRQRRTVLGGTDAAAILGLSRYRGPWDVFAEKAGLLAPGGEMSEDAMWGLLLEPVIIREYERRTGASIRRARALIRHPERTWQGGHIDGLGEDRVLEVKVRRSDADWGEPGSAEVPPAVKIQVEHYLAVTGKPFGEVAVLFRGSKLELYRIPADPRFLADLSEEEGEWWRRHVVLGVEPDFDGSPGASAYLRRAHPKADGSTLVAMPHQYAMLDDFSKVRARRAFYEQREETMKQTLMATLGDASTLRAPGLTIHWLRPGPTEQVDWPRYAESLEGLVEQVAIGALSVTEDPLQLMAGLRSLYTSERPGRPQLRVYHKKENQLA